ncbi:TetR/AcrR family transcriptional regulator [Actinacidiphila rubida]|uniref:Transcriptional regulator, TetR family n=1 Tax=Actinacidiphila rubida TaxID=310780 RepID=A0A1H8EBR5_9ACTN|nr:TetR/AcrR family transcriptional regulator [Actinacidiphila rubida]SEN16866.1 transcriptional regulator, TetR family [Actinacidiphila rubida]
MKTRPYHHGDLRAALLARAERTLHERGSAALSLRELARDLDVSPGAPSRHFRTKQALLDALALSGFERLTQDIAASQERAGESFADRLDAAARAYVGFAIGNPALLDLMFSAKHGPEASEALGGAAGRWADQILEVIVDGQRRGDVREGPCERVALPVFAALHGFATLAVSGTLPPEVIESGLDDVIAATLRGCEPRRN